MGHSLSRSIDIPYPDPSSDPDQMLVLVENLMFSAQPSLMADDENCPPPFGATGEGNPPENAPCWQGFGGDCD